MKNVDEAFKNLGFKYDKNLINKSYKEAMKDDTFKEIISNLAVSEEDVKQRTTLFEKSAHEYKNCKNCSNIFDCKNEITGYCYLPMLVDGNIQFNYEACKFKKELDKKNKYMNNIYLFDTPKELKEAKMSEIYLDDAQRKEMITWLKDFILNYKKGSKGLYLHGGFGCGKTYLIAAAFNELAKRDIKSAIIYWPEFLRDLKASFSDDFKEKYEFIKNIELLLIDDIGAEVTTEWARDEILGTILQYRMQAHKTTFFTSNFTIKELENSLANSKNSIEEVKARRIIERINQLTTNIYIKGKNYRN